MTYKIGMVLAACIIGAIMLLAFDGWRQAGMALLPLKMAFC